MEVRAYYATTIEAAMETARRELGPEAMLVQSRRSPAETAHLGCYEVVFAGQLPADFSVSEARLLPVAWEDVAQMEPRNLVSAEPDIRCEAGHSPLVALVGPPGSGKTTTLMKLAMQFGVMAGVDFRIFSIDHLRVGAAEALRRFAAVLGAPFEAFDSVAEFSRAVRTAAPGLTFIDTPGFSSCERVDLESLAACFQEHPSIESHLVLRVDRKTADNLSAIQRFAPFCADRLILTALDETSECKEIRTILTRANIPVSFLGVGPAVPEGLEAARSERLAELMLYGWPELRAA